MSPQNNRPLFFIPTNEPQGPEYSIFLLDERGKDTYESYRGTYCRGNINDPDSYRANGNNDEETIRDCRIAAVDYATDPRLNGTKSGAKMPEDASPAPAPLPLTPPPPPPPPSSPPPRPEASEKKVTPNVILDPLMRYKVERGPDTVELPASLQEKPDTNARPRVEGVNPGSVVSITFGIAAALLLSFLLFGYVKKRQNKLEHAAREIAASTMPDYSGAYVADLMEKSTGWRSPSHYSGEEDPLPPLPEPRKFSAASGKSTKNGRITSTCTFKKAICADVEIISRGAKYPANPVVNASALYPGAQVQHNKFTAIPEIYSSGGTHSLKVNRPSVALEHPNNTLDTGRLNLSPVYESTARVFPQRHSDINNSGLGETTMRLLSDYNMYFTNPRSSELHLAPAASNAALPSIYGLSGRDNVFHGDYSYLGIWPNNNSYYYSSPRNAVVSDIHGYDGSGGRGTPLSVYATVPKKISRLL